MPLLAEPCAPVQLTASAFLCWPFVVSMRQTGMIRITDVPNGPRSCACASGTATGRGEGLGARARAPTTGVCGSCALYAAWARTWLEDTARCEGCGSRGVGAPARPVEAPE